MGIKYRVLFLTISVVITSCATKAPHRRTKGLIEKNFEKQIAMQSEQKSYRDGIEFLNASDALSNNDFEQSAKSLESLVKSNSDDVFLKRKLAVTLIKGSKLKEALPYLKDVFKKSNYKDSQIGLVLGGVYAGLNERTQAEGIYKKILKADPKHVDACVFLGKSYAVTNKFKKAKQTLTNCSKRHNDQGIFDYYIGKMYVDKSDFKKAMYHFKKSLKLEPSYSQAALGIGLLYEQAKKNKRAVGVYEKFLTKNKNDVVILNRVVSLLFAMQKYKEVVPYAEALSDFDPDNLNLKVKLGILYTDTKSYDKAISTFKLLLKNSPKNDKLLYYLGAIYQETKSFESSIEYFSLISPESGLYQDSSIQVAQMLSKLASTDSSKVNQFVSFIDKKAKEFESLAVEFKVIEANHFQAKRQYRFAIESLESVEEFNEFKENHKFYLASLYESTKEFDKAYELMDIILKDNPNNAHALNFLGYSYVERGIRLNQAKTLLTRASDIRPQDGYIKDSLGWYYYKVGNTQKALKIITDASKMVNNDASIQKHLAIIYAKLNKFNLAKKFLKSAIKYSVSETTKKELESFIQIMNKNRLPASFE